METVTVGAIQALDVAPGLNTPIPAPGAGDALGDCASQTIECGALLWFTQVTDVPDFTVTGLVKEKPIGADELFTVAMLAVSPPPVVPPVVPPPIVYPLLLPPPPHPAIHAVTTPAINKVCAFIALLPSCTLFLLLSDVARNGGKVRMKR